MNAYGDSFWMSLKFGFLALPKGLRTILAINIAVFLVQSILILFGGQSIAVFFINVFGFYPEWSTSILQPWRLVTYMFFHAGVLHLVFNMLWLWWMGRPVEMQLGTRNFLVIYFGSGIGGALVNLLFSPLFAANITIGASGAVFGMMIAFAMLFPRAPIMLLFLPPIESRFLVAGLIAIDLLLISSADNVARIVHLGGALCGYIILKLYQRGYNYDLWFELLKQRFKAKSPPKAKAKKSTRPQNQNMKLVTDAEIVEEYDQDELDRILDKISKSGYEGLTAEEKRILFELSKKK
ncbi:rhomboid family intramembrane serine protease [Balneolaceae bacterium ANBcel3]|nr:rhomboid family intramembrane serine protease [Balneolaceae bacterium ANBcel3]